MKETLALIVEGTDERYVFSLRVNRRLKAGGEALSAELLDIGEALAERWLPEMQSIVFTSATISIAGNFLTSQSLSASIVFPRANQDRAFGFKL